MKRDSKPSDNENGNNEDVGGLYFNRKLRLVHDRKNDQRIFPHFNQD